MTKPTHITVGKAILTLVENPEVFDTYKGTFDAIHLEVKQQPRSTWMGFLTAASGILVRTPSPGYTSPGEAAERLEQQAVALQSQLADLLSKPDAPTGEPRAYVPAVWISRGVEIQDKRNTQNLWVVANIAFAEDRASTQVSLFRVSNQHISTLLPCSEIEEFWEPTGLRHSLNRP
jgi:hypothetical protein